jgi:hypothetical protein
LTPFHSAALDPMTPEFRAAMIADCLRTDPTMSEADAARLLDDIGNEQIFLNDTYQVNCRLLRASAPFPDIGHLSIKRVDKERVGVEKYRDFVRIKNEICGSSFEAVEIFPAYDDEIDTANQYHLWVFLDEAFRLPFGWHGKRLVSSAQPTNGKQEPI